MTLPTYDAPGRRTGKRVTLDLTIAQAALVKAQLQGYIDRAQSLHTYDSDIEEAQTIIAQINLWRDFSACLD